MELNVLYLYPDLLNLYGDRGNISAIRMVCEQMKVACHFSRVDRLEDTLDFENSDLILISPGQLSTFPVIIERLRKNEAELRDYIERGKYLFVVGTSACIFADTVKRIKRPSYRGLELGLFDCAERPVIYGDDLIYTCNLAGRERKVAGNQIQVVNTVLKDEGVPLGAVTYGYGNAHDGFEGARSRNLIFTNALGPVLVKNPWIAADIIADIMRDKGMEIDPDTLNFTLEKKSLAAIENFNAAKRTEL